jgi:competence protein ComEC
MDTAEGPGPPERKGPWRGAQAVAIAVGGARMHASQPLHLHLVLEAMRRRLLADIGPGRAVLGFPVAFAVGVGLYFAAPDEPTLLAPLLAVLALGGVAFAVRRQPVPLILVLVATCVAAGFLSGTVRARLALHPVLTQPLAYGEISGRVVMFETREKSDRVVLRLQAGAAGVWPPEPVLVRVVLRKGPTLPVGAVVALKTRLEPPPQPVRPGGLDLARDLYFKRIGAVGLSPGRARIVEAAPQAGWSLTAQIASMRERLSAAIRAATPGDAGIFADALVTGRQDGLSAIAANDLSVSSLNHILSVSGYHMALVAGVVFFGFRATLALVPGLALVWPIKKIAALAAFAATLFYLLLSGAEVATERAFLMTAVALIGVLADRPTVTLRALVLAALVILVTTPEALVQPSFQMSFSATLGLVGLYASWEARRVNVDPGALVQTIAALGLLHVGLAALSSFVASVATAPFVMFHFHRVSTYGVLANVLSTPVMAIWAMPAALVGTLLAPFGYDAPVWWLLGEATRVVLVIAHWSAALPGANLEVPSFGGGALVVFAVALLLACMLGGVYRLIGAAFAILGLLMALAAPRPDMIVSGDGRSVGVRVVGGQLAIHAAKRDPTLVRAWLQADGDERTPNDPSLAAPWRCQNDLCVVQSASGLKVAIALKRAANAPGCKAADILIGPYTPQADCPARVIDRGMLREGGALVGHVSRDGVLAIQHAGTGQGRRPWHLPAPKSATASPPPLADDAPMPDEIGPAD